MKCGRKICFHGAFKTKRAAMKKERQVDGAFVRKIHVRGRVRFSVMSRKGK